MTSLTGGVGQNGEERGNSDFIEVKDRSGGVITVCCQQIRETKAARAEKQFTVAADVFKRSLQQL